MRPARRMAVTGTQLKLVGMSRSHAKHEIAVKSARVIAAMIASEVGSVTIEDVYRRGISPQALGSAAGCVFHSPEFELVCYEKAERQSSHARVLGRWRLRGDGA